MISTKDGWIAVKVVYMGDGSAKTSIRPMNILKSEIIGVGESLLGHTSILLRGTTYTITILEPYEDFVIDFFTTEKTSY